MLNIEPVNCYKFGDSFTKFVRKDDDFTGQKTFKQNYEVFRDIWIMPAWHSQGTFNSKLRLNITATIAN